MTSDTASPTRPPPESTTGRVRALLIVAVTFGALLLLVPQLSTYHVRVIDTVLIYALLGIGTDAIVRALERRALRYRI